MQVGEPPFVATVDVRPACDVCGNDIAHFDAKTRQGPWAYLCPRCFGTRGVGLGLGMGQALTTRPQEDEE